MRMFRLLRLVTSNIRRSRDHFLLASVGIVVGIATFAFFTALGLGVRQVVLGKIFPLDQLEVVPKSLDVDLGPLRVGVGSDAITDEKVAELEQIPGVETVYPKMRLTVPSIGIGGEELLGANLRTEMIADGIEPDLVKEDIHRGYEFKDYDADGPPTEATPCTSDDECTEERTYCGFPAGAEIPPNALRRRAKDPEPPPLPDKVCRHYVPVLASEHVIELYNGALRRAHGFPQLNPDIIMGFTFDLTIGTSMVRGSNKDFVIKEKAMLVGFSRKAITLGLTMPIGYTKRYNVAFGSPADAKRFHSAMLIVPIKDDVAAVAKAVDEAGLKVADTGAEQAALLIAIFMAVFGLISVIIVGVAAVNIMHVFFMLVYERQHEIGIMRAVGASRGDVARIILGEAALLGAVAGAAGVLLSLGAAAFFDWLSVRYIPDFPYKPETYFDFPPWLVVTAIGFSVAFCVLGAFMPARRAARMEPARVLTGQ